MGTMISRSDSGHAETREQQSGSREGKSTGYKLHEEFSCRGGVGPMDSVAGTDRRDLYHSDPGVSIALRLTAAGASGFALPEASARNR